MLQPITATRRIKRPKKREVSRSFRIPPDVDRALDQAAAAKRWSKSFLIRDILVGWLTYHRQLKKVEGAVELPPESTEGE
jgi:hypothetical protein